MACQRCNISDRPTERCLVAKGLGEAEREYCRECRDYTRRTYPVTVLEGPQDAKETPQDGPQTASAETAAPKGRRPAHANDGYGGPLCGQSGERMIVGLPTDPVTCRRCLAVMKREDS